MNINFSGEVITGRRLGRKLGFPTANISIDLPCDVTSGVYAVGVKVRGGHYFGVANVGHRPTVELDSDAKLLLEVNIFDFSETIYGEVIYVELLQRLRAEVKFDSIDELKAQIKQDKIRAKELLKNN